MRRLWTIIIFLILATTCYAAKMSTYPKTSTLNGSDQFLVTVDPSGTPSTQAINWADLQAILPEGGSINWLQMPVVDSAGINWTDIKSAEMQTAGINWDFTKACLQDGTNCPASSSVNWLELPVIDSEGINWVDVENQEIQTAGINWDFSSTCLQDGTNCPAAGSVNWLQMPVVDSEGINWTDIRYAEMHTDGINWAEGITQPIITTGSPQYFQAVNSSNPAAGTEGRFAGQDSDNYPYYDDGTAWRKIWTNADKLASTAINWDSLDQSVRGAGINWNDALCPPGEQTLRFAIASPDASSDFELGNFPCDMTIDNILVLALGSTLTGGLKECNSNGASCSSVDSDITASPGTTAQDDGSLSNAGISAGNVLQWLTTSVSGTVTRVVVWVRYHFNSVF